MHSNATQHNRRTRFKAALAYAGVTAKQWAEERGITRTHLHAVLRGDRDSARLAEQIDRFIDEQIATAA